MSTYSHEYQREFTWRTTPRGLPIAEAVRLGDVTYVKVCPACGGFHEIKVASRVKPVCFLRKYAARESTSSTLWQRMYQRWLEKYPQAESLLYVSVKLVELYPGQWARTAEPVGNMEGQALVEKPKRSRAGRKAKAA